MLAATIKFRNRWSFDKVDWVFMRELLRIKRCPWHGIQYRPAAGAGKRGDIRDRLQDLDRGYVCCDRQAIQCAGSFAVRRCQRICSNESHRHSTEPRVPETKRGESTKRHSPGEKECRSQLGLKGCCGDAWIKPSLKNLRATAWEMLDPPTSIVSTS